MNDSEFAELVEAALGEIETAVDDIALDLERTGDGLLEIGCSDGRRIVVNRHDAAREIWVADRSGGFHYRWHGASWHDTRSGDELIAAVYRLVAGTAECSSARA